MTGPIVVAGGGPAGAAVAALLARAGREVVVFEREARPVDKMCGEFVSAEALDSLGAIGLDVGALGGHPIGGLRLVRGTEIVTCTLPFTGLGLSRRVLDEALLRHCETAGATIRRGRCLRFLHAGDGVVLQEDGGEVFSAGALFLATGKHDLQRLRRTVPARSGFIGVKLHLRPSSTQRTTLAHHVEIVLLRTGYAGLQLVEDGIANLCLLVGRAQFAQAGGTLQGLIESLRQAEPHLAQRLAGSVPLFARPLSIAGVPYGYVHRPHADDPDQVFRLGDQMGVIPSFTGDGISIALHSAAVAASCYLAGASAAAYHRRMRSDIARQIALAGWLQSVGTSALSRGLVMHLAKLFPGGLRLAAKLTRLSPRALSRPSLLAAGG